MIEDRCPSPDCTDFMPTISLCPEPPEKEGRVNATPIGDETHLPFETTDMTFDGPGGCMIRPNIRYCYTATCTGNVTTGLCGSSSDTKLALYDGCECDPIGTMLCCNDD